MFLCLVNRIKNMKKIIAFISLVTIAYSCTVNSMDDLQNRTIENWQLVSITDNATTSQTTNELNIEERLTLLNDSLFTRTRQADANSWVLEGTYSLMNVDNNKYLVLHYNTESNIIGNCSNNLNEVFIFNSDNEISNTWYQCGGPKLQYRKSE